MKLKDVLIDEMFRRNQRNIDELKSNLNTKEEKEASWAFCLGAGVSISCGLPDWSKLLAIISGNLLNSYTIPDALDNELLQIMAELIEHIEKSDDFIKAMSGAAQGTAVGIYRNIDPLELAEYIRTMVGELFGIRGNDELINRILHEYIKESFGVKWDADNKIVGYDESTLKAVVEMMENKNIRRAITYNYDDLLEISLREDGNRVETIVPEEKKEFAEGTDVYRVYHCHGLVPVRDSADLEQITSQIILTETSYYNEEASNYSLANVLQAYSMNYCNLLYVGFSGADYTFRRIIRGLGLDKDEMQHYIFFCADDIVNMVYDGTTNKEITKDEFIRQVGCGNTKYDYERLMINQLIVSKTLYWKEKGMNVIWSTWEELPQVLMGL
ncbi:MAG: hypothetical protein HDR04_03515 [Lachnospiraceae bacterium]|nr:hypothetical protein [Lachnospiraceae bacterium]